MIIDVKSYPINLVHTIKTGNESVHCVLFTTNKKLITANEGTNINIYSYPKYEKENTLVGHTKIINYLSEYSPDELLSCSTDKTIKLWDLKDCTLIESFDVHTDIVWKVIPIKNEKYKGYFASCSSDKTVRMFDDTNQLLSSVLGHTKPVNSIIELKNGSIISGSDDGILTGWDAYECLKLFEIKGVSTYSSNSLIELENGNVLSGYYSKIFVIDIEKQCIKNTIEINHLWGEQFVASFYLKDDLIYLGLNKKIGIMDNKYKLLSLKNKDVHDYYVFNICPMENGLIATCSNSGTVKIWQI